MAESGKLNPHGDQFDDFGGFYYFLLWAGLTSLLAFLNRINLLEALLALRIFGLLTVVMGFLYLRDMVGRKGEDIEDE